MLRACAPARGRGSPSRGPPRRSRRRRRTRTRRRPAGARPAACARSTWRAQHVARRDLDARAPATTTGRPARAATRSRCAARRSVSRSGTHGHVGPAVLLADLGEALVDVLLVVVDVDRATRPRRRGAVVEEGGAPARACPSACPGGRACRSRRCRSSPASTARRSSSTVSDWPSAMLSRSHRAVLDAPWNGPYCRPRGQRRYRAARPRSAARCSTTSSRRADPNAHLLPVEQARANFEALFEGLRPGESVAVHGRPRDPGRRRHDPGALLPAQRRARASGSSSTSTAAAGCSARVESHDTICRSLANASGAVVLNVGYRCAPECEVPAPPPTTRWPPRAGRTRTRPSSAATRAAWPIAGDSAGGNLAAVVAQDLRDAGEDFLRFQLLVYPVTTGDIDIGFDMAYEAHFLYRDEILWHYEHYLASPERSRPAPRLAALRRRARPAAGADPVRRVRPAAPAGRALPRPPAGRRRARRVPRLRRHDPRLLRASSPSSRSPARRWPTRAAPCARRCVSGPRMRIVGIGGSTRPGSSTERLVAAVLDAAAEHGAETHAVRGPGARSCRRTSRGRPLPRRAKAHRRRGARRRRPRLRLARLPRHAVRPGQERARLPGGARARRAAVRRRPARRLRRDGVGLAGGGQHPALAARDGARAARLADAARAWRSTSPTGSSTSEGRFRDDRAAGADPRRRRRSS